MVIYLDLLFLFNFVINFIFLYVVEIIYKEKRSFKRLVLGALVGGLMVILFLFNYIVLEIGKY